MSHIKRSRILSYAVLPSAGEYLHYGFNGTPSARRPVRPRPGPCSGRWQHAEGRAGPVERVPRRRRRGSRGSLAVVGAAARPAAAAPLPRARHCPGLSAVTPPQWPRLPKRPGRPPAPGILSPRKITVKSAPACGLHVLRMALRATLDGDLPRQDPAPVPRREWGRIGLAEPSSAIRRLNPYEEGLLRHRGRGGQHIDLD